MHILLDLLKINLKVNKKNMNYLIVLNILRQSKIINILTLIYNGMMIKMTEIF